MTRQGPQKLRTRKRAANPHSHVVRRHHSPRPLCGRETTGDTGQSFCAGCTQHYQKQIAQIRKKEPKNQECNVWEVLSRTTRSATCHGGSRCTSDRAQLGSEMCKRISCGAAPTPRVHHHAHRKWAEKVDRRHLEMGQNTKAAQAQARRNHKNSHANYPVANSRFPCWSFRTQRARGESDADAQSLTGRIAQHGASAHCEATCVATAWLASGRANE